jgi:hypothetical protein
MSVAWRRQKYILYTICMLVLIVVTLNSYSKSNLLCVLAKSLVATRTWLFFKEYSSTVMRSSGAVGRYGYSDHVVSSNLVDPISLGYSWLHSLCKCKVPSGSPGERHVVRTDHDAPSMIVFFASSYLLSFCRNGDKRYV